MFSGRGGKSKRVTLVGLEESELQSGFLIATGVENMTPAPLLSATPAHLRSSSDKDL